MRDITKPIDKWHPDNDREQLAISSSINGHQRTKTPRTGSLSLRWIKILGIYLSIITPFNCISQSLVSKTVTVGAEQLDLFVPKLDGKRVALVVNYTATVGRIHLADTLQRLKINILKIFSPEHGFRGTAADGETVNDSIDTKTGIHLVSLYGKDYKPTSAQLSDIDVVVFDIQDVGARFYTYLSTLHNVMESCAENRKPLIVLDRPNPNAGYVDGPVLQRAFKSFVGMHPIPIAYGLTIGEMAQMINGEGWLGGGKKCDVEIIKLKNWKHSDDYSLAIKPSPNLPNDQAVRLYPSLCLFEGTVMSIGRGTPMPFQVIGNPALTRMKFQFTPVSIRGVSNHPPLENKTCFGMDLRKVPVERKIDLKYLLAFYKVYPEKEKFFTNYFNKLAGTALLKQQIIDGLSEDQIRESWKKDLDAFKVVREKYLLYPL